MDAIWVIVTIALVACAPVIGSVWWLVHSRHREQRQADAMTRMLTSYPPGPPPRVRVEEPPLIVVRPRRHVPASSMVPIRSHGRHARLD